MLYCTVLYCTVLHCTVLCRCAAKSLLAAGTNLGNILMWRHQPQQEPADTGQHDNEVTYDL